VVRKRSTIAITKDPTDNRGNPIVPWYENYRIKDEDLVKKANSIWKELHEEN